MRRRASRCIAVVGGVCIALSASPLMAASDETEALLANVKLHTQFLIRAGDLAATNAASDKVRRFATAERAEQVGVLGRLAAEAGDMIAERDDQNMSTGRSVATGIVETGTFAPPGGLGVLMPAASISLDHLARAKGDALDALYTAITRSVLADLAGFYDACAATCDDPTLRAWAAREGPKILSDKAALE